LLGYLGDSCLYGLFRTHKRHPHLLICLNWPLGRVALLLWTLLLWTLERRALLRMSE
jgi:hypothetical protein